MLNIIPDFDCQPIEPNELEVLAESLGFELVIEEMPAGWTITQYIDGPCLIETPFLIDGPVAAFKLREMLSGDDVGGASWNS